MSEPRDDRSTLPLAKVTITIEYDDGETQIFEADRVNGIEMKLSSPAGPGDGRDAEGAFSFRMRPGSDGRHYRGTHCDEPRWLPGWGAPPWDPGVRG